MLCMLRRVREQRFARPLSRITCYTGVWGRCDVVMRRGVTAFGRHMLAACVVRGLAESDSVCQIPRDVFGVCVWDSGAAWGVLYATRLS